MEHSYLVWRIRAQQMKLKTFIMDQGDMRKLNIRDIELTPLVLDENISTETVKAFYRAQHYTKPFFHVKSSTL